MGSPYEMDLGGMTIVANGLRVGATAPGQAGTELTGSEIAYLDGLTPGTATASKAVVLDSSKGIATITSATITTLTAPTIAGATTHSGVVTFDANPVIGAGKTIDLDSATATLSSNAATLTKYAGVITTESLNTAGGASQALVLTLTGVAATDLVFVQYAGGSNTTSNFTLNAVSTTNTVTVTVYNNTAATALNGTLIFNLWVLKA